MGRFTIHLRIPIGWLGQKLLIMYHPALYSFIGLVEQWDTIFTLNIVIQPCRDVGKAFKWRDEKAFKCQSPLL